VTDAGTVVELLYSRAPDGLTPSQITELAQFPHGQRTGGVLRRLENGGVIERWRDRNLVFLSWPAIRALEAVRGQR
jgi:hypothetical protein